MSSPVGLRWGTLVSIHLNDEAAKRRDTSVVPQEPGRESILIINVPDVGEVVITTTVTCAAHDSDAIHPTTLRTMRTTEKIARYESSAVVKWDVKGEERRCVIS